MFKYKATALAMVLLFAACGAPANSADDDPIVQSAFYPPIENLAELDKQGAFLVTGEFGENVERGIWTEEPDEEDIEGIRTVYDGRSFIVKEALSGEIKSGLEILILSPSEMHGNDGFISNVVDEREEVAELSRKSPKGVQLLPLVPSSEPDMFFAYGRHPIVEVSDDGKLGDTPFNSPRSSLDELRNEAKELG